MPFEDEQKEKPTDAYYVFLASGMWSLSVHRLGGAEERRQQIELLWHRGVLCLQGEFMFTL